MNNLSTYINKIKFIEKDYSNEKLYPNVIFKKFQDAAVKHAEMLGLGYNETLNKGFLWVTSGIKFEFVNKIIKNIDCDIATFFQSGNVFELNRDFLIKQNGNICVKGTSKWCLIDVKNRKLAKLSNLKFNIDFHEAVFDGKMEKIHISEVNNKSIRTYIVNKKDIDANNHMNNTIYARLVQSTLNNSELSNIKKLQIDFLREAKLGDAIEIYKTQNHVNMQILGKFKNGDNCFVASIIFENTYK